MKSFVDFLEEMNRDLVSEAVFIDEGLEKYGTEILHKLASLDYVRKAEVHKEDFDLERFSILLTIDASQYGEWKGYKDVKKPTMDYYLTKAENLSSLLQSRLGIPSSRVKETTVRKQGLYKKLYSDDYKNDKGFTVNFYIIFGKSNIKKDVTFEAVVNITNERKTREGQTEFSDFPSLVPGTVFVLGGFSDHAEYEIVKRVGYKLWIRIKGRDTKQIITARISRNSDQNLPEINIQYPSGSEKSIPIIRKQGN